MDEDQLRAFYAGRGFVDHTPHEGEGWESWELMTRPAKGVAAARPAAAPAHSPGPEPTRPTPGPTVSFPQALAPTPPHAANPAGRRGQGGHSPAPGPRPA
jgi:hypothetical protein